MGKLGTFPVSNQLLFNFLYMIMQNNICMMSGLIYIQYVHILYSSRQQ
jgi:hypothetical protein